MTTTYATPEDVEIRVDISDDDRDYIEDPEETSASDHKDDWEGDE